jgi:hypothetical protein
MPFLFDIESSCVGFDDDDDDGHTAIAHSHSVSSLIPSSHLSSTA